MTAKASTKRAAGRANNSSPSSDISRPSSEPRRANKPLMEKRRRARINQSLAVLKTLILDSAKSDNTKHSKLEKADILELTVRHFQRHRNLDTPGLNKYRAGYADCVREVQRYLDTPDAQTMCVIDPGVRQRLLRHLENCVAEIDTDISPTTALTNPAQDPAVVAAAAAAAAVESKRLAAIPALPADVMFATAVTEQEKKARLEPDSSTAEEINNNNGEPGELTIHAPGQLPGNPIKMYDGNFVFVLPSHYVQLAAALGINLNGSGSGPGPGPGTAAEATPPTHPPPTGEKPLDYSSKNNETGESMWRPW